MSNTQGQTIENLTLKNISGEVITWRHMENNTNDGMYNRSGVRYFAIKLDDEFAENLESLGWPVVWRNINHDESDSTEIMQGYLKVFIKYGTRFPVDIYLVNKDNRSKTLLNEEDLDNLHIDSKPIDSIDIMIRPYFWTYGNEHGVKAQVRAMNIRLAQDGLDDDYEIIYKD